MAHVTETSGACHSEKETVNGAVQTAAATTLLGRPAVVLTLGTGGGAGCGERSHKRSRPNDAGDSSGGDGAPGGVQQVIRSMLRAQRLGVLVPLVYHADVVTGQAMLEAVPGRRLGELLQAAAAAAATAGEATAEAAAGAAVDSKALPTDLDRAATLLGRALATLHDGGQVHNNLGGDSVVLREADGAVVLTDFSRSFNTIVALDKAQDLANLETALLKQAEGEKGKGQAADGGVAEGTAGEGARPDDKAKPRGARIAAQVFERVLAAYRAASRLWSATHNKLAEVRGRSTTQQQQPNKRAKAATEVAAS